MKTADVSAIRMDSQQIRRTTFTEVKDLVSWMGAIQAQDHPMANWAIGTRLPGFTEAMVDAATDRAEIIRTHILRPTWHFVAATDIYWMLQLTASQVMVKSSTVFKQMGITEAVCHTANDAIIRAFKDKPFLSRDELILAMEEAGLSNGRLAASHLLFQAELAGILCSGIKENNRQTYALLEVRVPKPAAISRDEALSKLALRYFRSHGPATLNDFVWWSGLPVRDAKRGLQMVETSLFAVDIEGGRYWSAQEYSSSVSVQKDEIYLLPAFDEFLISYKDRTASFLPQYHSKAFTVNGIFHPVIVVDHQVCGLWKRAVKKDKVHFEASFFKAPSKKIKLLTEKAAFNFAVFLGKELIVNEIL